LKDAYYFSHDANARHDPKCSALIAAYGMEGYGRYWVIIEMLREEADHRLEISASYVRNALAVQMQCDVDAAHKFVQDCIGEFQLFETDGDYFWSNSLLRRMDLRKARSEQARQAAMARWEGKKKSGKNADAMRLQCDRNAIKGKERKVKIKERKEKQILSGAQENRFETFWTAYPKKRSKGAAEKAWAKIKPNEQLTGEILSALERAKTSADWQKDGGQYIPYPATWLNAKGWEDDYTPAPTVPKGWGAIKEFLEDGDDDDES